MTNNTNAMSEKFLKSHLLSFGDLVGVAGRDFQNVQNAASVLNTKSVRVVHQLLEKCNTSLMEEEK